MQEKIIDIIRGCQAIILLIFFIVYKCLFCIFEALNNNLEALTLAEPDNSSREKPPVKTSQTNTSSAGKSLGEVTQNSKTSQKSPKESPQPTKSSSTAIKQAKVETPPVESNAHEHDNSLHNVSQVETSPVESTDKTHPIDQSSDEVNIEQAKSSHVDKQNSQKSAEESTQSTNLHGSLQQSTPPENDKPANTDVVSDPLAEKDTVDENKNTDVFSDPLVEKDTVDEKEDADGDSDSQVENDEGFVDGKNGSLSNLSILGSSSGSQESIDRDLQGKTFSVKCDYSDIIFVDLSSDDNQITLNDRSALMKRKRETIERMKEILGGRGKEILFKYHTACSKTFKNDLLQREGISEVLYKDLVMNTLMCLNKIATELEKPDESTHKTRFLILKCAMIDFKNSKEIHNVLRGIFTTYSLFSLSMDDKNSNFRNRVPLKCLFSNGQWNLKNDQASWVEFYRELFKILTRKTSPVKNYYENKQNIEGFNFADLAKLMVLYVKEWNKLQKEQGKSPKSKPSIRK